MERSRAFIAAPLIGSIMFLVATVFVVGMVTAESQEVNRATVDAYHGKLVSMLELYRLDLYSLFVDGLRQNVEDFLANTDWVNLNGVGDAVPYVRFQNCQGMKSAIFEQITGSGSGGAFLTCHGNPPVCDSQSFLNGLPDLLKAMRNENLQPSYEFHFEGVSFRPVIFDSTYWNFTCSSPPSAGGLGKPSGRQLCQAMIPRAEFDCRNFAENPSSPFQCCSVENGNQACEAAGGTVLKEGCDNGGFLLAVNLKDPNVFRYMPRIDATDGAGNEIRSGALGEDALDLRIRYPIFKYLDASFGFFSRLQYKNDDPNAGREGAMTMRKFAGRIKRACGYLDSLRLLPDPEHADLSARIWLQSQSAFVMCSSATNVACCKYQPGANSAQCGKDGVVDSAYSACPAQMGKFVAHIYSPSSGSEDDGITQRNPKVEFFDHDPRFRVNPDRENLYAWDANLCFPVPNVICGV